jgi:aldehyde dehydrogenase (NAD+)
MLIIRLVSGQWQPRPGSIQMRGLYFEEFEIGAVYRHALTRTVTEFDNVLYTSMTMNVQPLHLDEEFASKTVHGHRVVNSMFTLGLVAAFQVPELTLGTTLGNLGYEKVSFPRPVFHGDTLRCETTIKDKRASKTRTDAGIVWFEHRAYNQRDEIVCVAERVGMMMTMPREPDVDSGRLATQRDLTPSPASPTKELTMTEAADSTPSTYIHGDWQQGTSTDNITTISPSSGEVLAVTATSSLEQVDAAVASSRAAFNSPEWRAYGPAERAAVLRRMADLIEANNEELAQLIVDEVGSPIGLARAMQVGSPVETLRWYADMAVRGPRGGYEKALPLYDNPVLSSSVLRYEPVGVVAALVAFNYPINLLIWKLGGALASGCTTVVLPSPQGVLSTIKIFGLFEQLGLPPGVINLVVGGPDVGQRLTGHPDVDMVSFTGSDAVGAKVMAQAAIGGLAKSVLELGGKAANIVLPGTELAPTIAPTVLRFARHAGQGCAAWTRILVHESQVDEFVALARDFIDGLAVGDPHSEKTEVGPVISVAHRDKVERLIQKALDDGGQIIIGGGRPDLAEGSYINPTVIAGLPPDHPIANTELFAPVAILLPYKTVDEAIEIANQTVYGLNANVFGPLGEAIAVAERLRAGTVTVNGGSGMRPDAPWGGLGRSGVGRELGEDGFAEFFEVKHIQWPLGAIGRPPGT